MKYKRLITFDFDDTLFKTPTPHEGKEIWKDVTGKEWPHRGWWSKRESLDTEIFDIPLNPPIYKQYLKAISDPENYVVLATGRIEPLRAEVEDILLSNDLEFQEIHLNHGTDTYDFKRDLFTRLINKIKPELYVMYDDREEHLVRFREWADTLPCKTIIVDAKTGEKYETSGNGDSEFKNLRESIKSILKEETHTGLFIRRRVTEDQLEEGFRDALKYGEKFLQRYPLLKMKEYREIVMNVVMDHIHGELSKWGTKEFPYNDVRNYLTNRFIARIKERYEELKNGE